MSVKLDPKHFALVCGPDNDGRGPGWAPEEATGVCYSKPYLHFATVRLTDKAKFKLVRKACAAFWFCERHPEATRELEGKVSHFVSKHVEGEVVLRCTDLNGQYAGLGLSFKAEALLDLAVGPTLLLARTSNVSRWVYNHEPRLPEPDKCDLPKQWYNGQVRAIETAAYMLTGGKVIEAGELSVSGELHA
jgi:hypothetical protein